jgi:hypothetical protein
MGACMLYCIITTLLGISTDTEDVREFLRKVFESKKNKQKVEKIT